MESRGELRRQLLDYVRRKFRSRAELACFAEDIVNDAFLELYGSKSYGPEKENFGYMSVACVRIAFRYFKAWDVRKRRQSDLDECLWFVSEEDFVDDIVTGGDTAAVLESLATLKSIERIIITQRYYADFTFARIAEANGLKLNTVLTHHRRALEKLRPVMTAYFGFDGTDNNMEED